MTTVGRLRTTNCGQAVHGEPGPNADQLGAFGEIKNVFDLLPQRCPEFHPVLDITNGHYENIVLVDRTERGLIFDDIISLWIQGMQVGGDGVEFPLVEFSQVLHTSVDQLLATGTPRVGVLIEDTTFGTFNVHAPRPQIGVLYSQTDDGDWGTANNRVVINARNNFIVAVIVDENVDDDGFSTDDIATGAAKTMVEEVPAEDTFSNTDTHGIHYFTGNITTSTQDGMIVETTDATVHIDQMCFRENAGTDLVVPSVEENQVRVTDSAFGQTIGQPKTIDKIGVSTTVGRPDPTSWKVGDIVQTEGTPTGDGVYLKLRDTTWKKF